MGLELLGDVFEGGGANTVLVTHAQTDVNPVRVRALCVGKGNVVNI